MAENGMPEVNANESPDLRKTWNDILESKFNAETNFLSALRRCDWVIRNNCPATLYDKKGSSGFTGNARCNDKKAGTGHKCDPGTGNNLMRAD
jgi:hypothetical protein